MKLCWKSYFYNNMQELGRAKQAEEAEVKIVVKNLGELSL